MREIVDDRIGQKSTPDPSLRPPNCLNFESGPWRGALFFPFFYYPALKAPSDALIMRQKFLAVFFHHTPTPLSPLIHKLYFIEIRIKPKTTNYATKMENPNFSLKTSNTNPTYMCVWVLYVPGYVSLCLLQGPP